MSWKYSDEALLSRGLSQVPLDALQPDGNEYDVMLYQHCGQLAADRNGVANADHNESVAKFSALFRLASEEQPQLLVTPEYSCPWSVIEQQIEDNQWPRAGAAWVIGCESIRPDELTELRARQDSVVWLVSAFTPLRDQIFLDAVCVFMTALNADGNVIKVLVVQAKGHAMADWRNLIEPNSLILGRERFILRNDESSIHLAVFICSDALEPDIFRSLPIAEHLPYIILHVQLNPDPRHLSFRSYRDLWGSYDRNNIEVICLNWAKGTEVLGHTIQFGGSAWYYKSSDVTASDGEVNQSHQLGAYYVENSKRYFHCHILNYAQHIFKLRCCKVSQTRSVPPSRRKRIGPRAIAAYSWEPTLSEWRIGSVDDGFADCCARISDNLRTLMDTVLSPVDKERLVCLASAEINNSKKFPWPHVRSLPSFEMTEGEVCHRITFCHDPDRESHERRHRRLHLLRVLNDEVMSSMVSFPEHVQQLQRDGRIMYPASHIGPSYNVVDSNGQFPAVFVYLGEILEHHAKEKMIDLVDIIGEARRSLVVWFRHNGQLNYVYPDRLANFDANLEESPKSIVRE